MVALGPGRIGWAYIANPTYKTAKDKPPCDSAALQFNVYSR